MHTFPCANAIADAGLDEALVSSSAHRLDRRQRRGDLRSTSAEGLDLLREKGIRRVGAFRVAAHHVEYGFRANLATAFRILGREFIRLRARVPRARTASGAAYEQIQWGKQDLVFAGGGEEEDG